VTNLTQTFQSFSGRDNSLNAVGIRVRLRPIERAAFYQGWADKKYKNLIQGGNSRFGNAATRIEHLLVGGGTYAHGSYADVDGLFWEQARELDPKRREATLHRIQQLVYDKAIVAPIWQLAGLNGIGPRVEESGLGLIAWLRVLGAVRRRETQGQPRRGGRGSIPNALRLFALSSRQLRRPRPKWP